MIKPSGKPQIPYQLNVFLVRIKNRQAKPTIMKFPKILKRLFIALFLLVVLFIGALIAIPYFFKDQLLQTIKDTVNSSINGDFDFEDANLSLLRSFPDASVKIDNYQLMGKDVFEGVPLVKGKAVEVNVNIWSLLQSDQPMQIKGIRLDEPSINIQVLNDGTANYDIALPDTSTTVEANQESVPFELELKKYEINKGSIVYLDRLSNTELNLSGLNHEGSAKIQTNVYNLFTNTQIESLSLAYDNISYFKTAKADIQADVKADLDNMIFTLMDNNVRLNELQLKADGFVNVGNPDKIELDLKFEAPGNDFRELLSMIPSAFVAGYEDVKVSGAFRLAGHIFGHYSADSYPGMDIQMVVDKGAFQYPDLPLGISNIQTEIKVNKPQGDLDRLLLDVVPFEMNIGDAPLAGFFKLRTPISDPDIATRLDGKINLADVQKAFPVDGVQQMAGIIDADVQIETRMSTIDKGNYEAVKMDGALAIANLIYQAEGLPKVELPSAKASFSPQFVDVPSFTAKLGQSDLSGKGRIDNLLAYITPAKTMSGNFELYSSLFNANEWMPEESTSNSTSQDPTPSSTSAAAPFNRFEFDFAGQFDKILYDAYTLLNTNAKGKFAPNLLVLNSAGTQIEKSDIKANGTITGLWDYVFEDGVLGGELNIVSKLLDLNELMALTASETATATTTSTPVESYPPITIPANIDLKINSAVDRVLYTTFDLKNLNGTLDVTDQSVILENLSTSSLGGDILLQGAYDTKDPEEPTFNFKYDLDKLNFKQSFQAFNTFQSFGPIGQFIEGTFNSSMIMSGKIGNDMMPVMESLNADGFLETINGTIKNFTPLQAVGQQFNVDYFDDIQINNTRNWFEIKNGAVEVKEFTTNVKDIKMDIGGTHGLNQQMNYKMLATVPREVVENSPAGSLFNQGSDWFRQQAGNLGVAVEKAENFLFQINLTGQASDPKVAVKMVGTEGTSVAETAKETAQAAIDKEKEKLKEQAEDKLEEGKAQAQEEIDKAKKKAEEEAKKKAEEIAKEAKEKAGDALGSKTEEEIEKVKDKVEDQFGDKGKEGVDKIKEKLEDFNPFKNRNKGKKKDGN